MMLTTLQRRCRSRKVAAIASAFLFSVPALAATGPLPAATVFHGAVAVDPHTGRAAILRDGLVKVCDGLDETSCAAAFPSPLPSPILMAFRGGAILLGEGGCEDGCRVLAVDDTGGELLEWRERTGNAQTSLLEDGSGVFQVVELTSSNRKDLGLTGSLPGVDSAVVTRRFSDGRRSIFAAPEASGSSAGSSPLPAVRAAAGLTADDVVMLTRAEAISRWRGDRCVFRTALEGWWNPTDVEPAQNLLLAVNSSTGAVKAVDLSSGAVRWTWDGVARQDAIRKLFASSPSAGLRALPDRIPDIETLLGPRCPGLANENGPCEAALQALYGAADARVLPGGDVLVVGKTIGLRGVPPWAAVLDPATGTLRPGEVFDRLAQAGLPDARGLAATEVLTWFPDRGLQVTPRGELVLRTRARCYAAPLQPLHH